MPREDLPRCNPPNRQEREQIKADGLRRAWARHPEKLPNSNESPEKKTHSSKKSRVSKGIRKEWEKERAKTEHRKNSVKTLSTRSRQSPQGKYLKQTKGQWWRGKRTRRHNTVKINNWDRAQISSHKQEKRKKVWWNWEDCQLSKGRQEDRAKIVWRKPTNKKPIKRRKAETERQGRPGKEKASLGPDTLRPAREGKGVPNPWPHLSVRIRTSEHQNK